MTTKTYASVTPTTPNRRRLLQGISALTVGLVSAGLARHKPVRAADNPPMQFVVAHGAWSSGWAWKKVHPLMKARGHLLYTPSYTGLGERIHLANPDVDLDTQITDVVNMLEYEDLHDVILVGHSYGGMVATGVADRARSRLRQLIYLDAFVPQDGQSLADLTGGGDNLRANAVDGWRVPPSPAPADTSEEDLAWIMPRRQHHPIKCFEQALVLTNGPLTLPRQYIVCTRNAGFLRYAEQAKQAGWPVHELDATHSPNVTAPQALVDLLLNIT
jgi:pimeloyl-ACP methyl ester carboxylesterase